MSSARRSFNVTGFALVDEKRVDEKANRESGERDWRVFIRMEQ